MVTKIKNIKCNNTSRVRNISVPGLHVLQPTVNNSRSVLIIGISYSASVSLRMPNDISMQLQWLQVNSDPGTSQTTQLRTSQLRPPTQTPQFRPPTQTPQFRPPNSSITAQSSLNSDPSRFRPPYIDPIKPS